MADMNTRIKHMTLFGIILLTSSLIYAESSPASAEETLHPDDYTISSQASETLRNQNALSILDNHLRTHPELKRRLIDESYTIPDENWGYYDQAYEHENTMRHLIANQIKAMAERQQVDDIEDIFDPDYGIGSKPHKDKGTINNVFSIWGHPVRDEILNGSTASTKTVYEFFRLTIKNNLKAYARSQTLKWHRQPVEIRVKATLEYLNNNHHDKTQKLSENLKAIQLDLEELIRRTLQTNLLS